VRRLFEELHAIARTLTEQAEATDEPGLRIRAERARALPNALRELLRAMYAGQSEREAQSVCPPTALVTEAASYASDLATGLPIDITCHPESSTAIAGRRNELKLALRELVRNGIDAMLEGGTLRIESFDTAEGVAIRISDSGVGIPAELAEAACTPFGSAENSLGLAMAAAVASAHRGSLSVEKLGTGGSAATLVVPGASG